MSEKIAIPRISYPSEVVAYKATMIEPRSENVFIAVNGNREEGILLSQGASSIDVVFDQAIDYIDMTVENNSSDAVGTLTGLGLDEGDSLTNFLSNFPFGQKLTYRFYTDINSKGSLSIKTSIPNGEVILFNLSGFRLIKKATVVVNNTMQESMRTAVETQENQPIQQELPIQQIVEEPVVKVEENSRSQEHPNPEPVFRNQVKAHSAKFRTQDGETIPSPSLVDGDLSDGGFTFQGEHYQFVQLTYSQPISKVWLTAINNGRDKPVSISFSGRRIYGDIRVDYPDGEQKTIEYTLPNEKGVLTFNTDTANGSFIFNEISAFSDS